MKGRLLVYQTMIRTRSKLGEILLLLQCMIGTSSSNRFADKTIQVVLKVCCQGLRCMFVLLTSRFVAADTFVATKQDQQLIDVQSVVI